LQAIVVELEGLEGIAIRCFPVQQCGLVSVVIEVGEAVESAGIAEAVPDTAFDQDWLSDSGKEAAGRVPVGGADETEGGLSAVGEEVFDRGVVEAAAKAGGVDNLLGAFFTD